MDYFQAIIFGLLQGITELFPISSLGHSVILPSILHWHIKQNDPFFLTFLVATHTATALVLLLFFWKDWVKIVAGLFRSLKEREIREHDIYAKLAWLLVVSTIPAGVLGLLFEDPLKTLFASPRLVAFVLLLNGIMLFLVEFLRKKSKSENHDQQHSDKKIAKLSWKQTIYVGLLQCLALIPGFSRTGATLTGGLLSALSHEDAARFSFLLATPVIGAAALLKLPELFTTTEQAYIGQILVGSITAAIGAYVSVKFLVKYFKTQTLRPFAIYCIVVGIIVSLLLLF